MLDGVGPRDNPSAEAIAAHALEPIPFELGLVDVAELSLGLQGKAISFSWRPYAERSAEDRADFDRLRESIRAEGIRSPLIVYGRAVLIGMRRAEIARELGIETVLVANVLEDVRLWWKHNLPRLEALRLELGATVY